ncbi:conserved hypothetical protein [Sporisorium reilianum SRZ2]|uniref:Zn(2)-C6 fungal-type domain-containing protein n=1 Tax=Sporisorium reilianum (strain SRZ2) TaxID=999809 RepID=E6ZXI0_SPORE|nr:conserved hypothetical protein [Sporisorium reilianum SRZ2]
MTSDIQQLQRTSISSASASSSAGSSHAAPLHRSRSPEPSDANRNKVIGACSSCRRSKVKCDHEGTAPCRRCKNGGYECTFKPKELSGALLQDEWRVKTDETLNKLVSTIDALVRHQDSNLPAKRRRTTAPLDWSDNSTAAHSSDAAFGMTAVGSRPDSSRGANGIHSTMTRAFDGPFGQASGTPGYHQFTARPNDVGMLSSSGSYLPSNSRRSSLVVGLNHSMDSLFHPNHAGTITAPSSTTEPHNPCPSAHASAGSLPLPAALFRSSRMDARPPHKPSLLARPSRYRHPDPSLGSSDPRLDAIRLGLLSSHEARSLFSRYAKTIEPLGFGFPDFPASSDLTHVLLSAITSVASLHSRSPDLRSRQLQLRADVLERTMPFAPTTAEDDFNPESGIGTEEVVGACIWSTYQGSEDAWRVARAARWWSEKYSYETGRHAGLTVGEMVAILPPVRHVTMQDRVRVWLTAFLAELHQCEIHGKEPIMELVDPAQYSQALMSSSVGALEMSKQDAGLVFYSRVAYVVAKARLEQGEPDQLVESTLEMTVSWCATRAVLATDPDKRDVYDHAVDLHHVLAKASMLIRACRLYEERMPDKTHGDVSTAIAAYVSCSQTCHHACMDAIKLLLSPSTGFVGSLAALPSIYHFWIAQCAVFLIELCMVDRLHYRLGLLVEGQLDEILRTVGAFVQQYIAELSACSTSIVVEEQHEAEARHEVTKHPAMDAALAVADVLASVQATA